MRPHCSLNFQKRLGYKENTTKYKCSSWKPRSHVTLVLYRTWSNENRPNDLSYPKCRTSRLGRTGVKFSGLVISAAKVMSPASFRCVGRWRSFGLCDHAFDVIVVETKNLMRERINFELTRFNKQVFWASIRHGYASPLQRRNRLRARITEFSFANCRFHLITAPRKDKWNILRLC